MRPENRIKLSFWEVVIYVGGDRVMARRIYRARASNRRSRRLSVFEIDGWLLKNVPKVQWPAGFTIDGVRDERLHSAVRRDFGARLQVR